MLTKLALRNATRSSKDYLIYMLTMTSVSAMMFAFDSMLFSSDIQKMFSTAAIMASITGMVTVFIVIIIAWLINYMARFMLERRSREFGTYLLIGMKRGDISSLYLKENLFLGTAAFLLGLVLGAFLQQVLMTIFYSIFALDYKLKLDFNIGCLIMTTACYYGSFLLALIRNRSVFKKLTIAELMRMEKESDSITERHEKPKQLLFFAAAAYMITAYIIILKGCSGVVKTLLILGFVIAVYVMYMGISSFIICRIKKGGNTVNRHNNLFIFRQFAAKAKSMQFTMGTLTVLMAFAILGGDISMMFSKCQSAVVDYGMPFDVIAYGAVPDEDFSKELELLESTSGVFKSHSYNIYTDGNHTMNEFYYTHVPTSLDYSVSGNDTYRDNPLNKTGKFREFYLTDTYIKLSNYNAIRNMLGYGEITLAEDEYAVHTKLRELKFIGEMDKVTLNGMRLSQVYTEALSQNGFNGADYVIVVPDKKCEDMKAMYSLMVADTINEVDRPTADGIMKIYLDKYGLKSLIYDMDMSALGAYGTDQIVTMVADIMVRDVDNPDAKFLVASVIFPLAYAALIFVFAAMTILSVQQLSDSVKYRFRYDILRKLGCRESEIRSTVFRQLALFYLLPAAASAVMSIIACVSIGDLFVKYIGIKGNGLYYFGVTFLLFIGIYLIYFLAAYIGFMKNIRREQ